MPSVSRDTVSQVNDFGPAEDRTHELDGYTVQFVSIRSDHDLSAILSQLPGGHCDCPHWGYVLKGTIIIRYGDVEEKVQAGEAFYMPPGHIPGATAGTEFVQFSPTDQLKPVLAAMAEVARKMHEA